VQEPGGALNFTCAAILFNGQYDLQRVAGMAEDLKRIGNALIEAAPASTADAAASAVASPVRRKSAAKPKPAAAAPAPRRRAAG